MFAGSAREKQSMKQELNSTFKNDILVSVSESYNGCYSQTGNHNKSVVRSMLVYLFKQILELHAFPCFTCRSNKNAE